MKKNLAMFFGILLFFSFTFSVISAAKSIHVKEFRAFKEDVVDDKEYVILLKDSIKNNAVKLGFSEKSKEFGGKKFLVMKLDETSLNDIKKLSYVEGVYENKRYLPFLQTSVPLINASLSWGLYENNVNLTGRGQSVCIIDTGANYSHPDLGGGYGDGYKIVSGYDVVYGDEGYDFDDMEGHGTHVAGIVGANGSIKGVATGASLVVVAAYDYDLEGFYTSDLLLAIDQCIQNKTRFNISVISMSLGGEQFDSSCDSYDIPLTNAIHDAINANISVVVATGNTYTGHTNATAGISNPACVSGVIKVSATDKSDNVASYAFRNSNFENILMAPGSLINSTSNSLGYESMSGTSMATPHVSGAIVILNQYLFLTNRTKTPEQIESVLNSTGKQIYDASSAKYYSRINVYSAIISLDEDNPNITLVTPSNGHINQSTNISFSCNATDLQLKNITFYLWNLSGNIINQTSFGVSGASNQTNIILINLDRGSYYWNCLAEDVNGNQAFSSSNFSLIINNISTTLSSPSNDSYVNINENNFTCISNTDSAFRLTNISFYLWNSSGNLIYNETKNISGVSNSSIFNYNFSYGDGYYWNCLSVNNASQNTFADANYSFTYDVVSPNVTIVLPSDAESYSSDSQSITFEYNVSDDFQVSNCSLIVNNIINLTNYSIINISNYFSQIFNPDSYSWSINCTDMAGNVANSSVRSFIISAPVVVNSPSSGGGGGGAGITVVSFISSEKLNDGVIKKMGNGERLTMGVSGINHSLSINKVLNNSVNITIRSDPINFIIVSGEERRLNLSSVDYYDLYIKLENVSGGKANLIIKSINEKISSSSLPVNGAKYISYSDLNSGGGNISGFNEGYIEMVVIIGSVFVLMIVFMVWRMIHLWRQDKKNGR